MADINEYLKALKLGERDYSRAVSRGEFPYIPALDDILKDVHVQAQEELGLVDIPLGQIVGTKTQGRQNAFARNFMPLMKEKSEFAMKWSNLFSYQMEEGVSDPIIAYEYMNQFYVLEGNKRVSVLKYLNAFSIEGYVTRIIPAWSPDPHVRILYEYMDFYRRTQINYIYFTKIGSFAALVKACGKDKDAVWTDEERSLFSSSYLRFSRLFGKDTGQRLGITTGDAFLFYLSVYPYDQMEEKTDTQLKSELDSIWKEVSVLNVASEQVIQTVPREDPQAGLFARFFASTGSRQLKIAFIHEKPIHLSGWTYGHELGRSYLEQVFGNKIATSAYYESDAPGDRMQLIERAIEDGNHILFATSQLMLEESLKAALQHPDVRILNCCVNRSFHSIRTYYGRMYEAKLLQGMIAGAMCRNDRIAYVADFPIYGTVANVNAFALGARMTNPQADVYLHWSSLPGGDLDELLREKDISMVCGVDMMRPGSSNRRYGLYMMDQERVRNLAIPLWNWGKFYEKIIRDILKGTFQSSDSKTGKSTSYWWGISGNIIDLIMAGDLPAGLRRLTQLVRWEIYTEAFHPFQGIITRQDGSKAGKEDGVLSIPEIIAMDWLCENVIGSIPRFESLNQEAQALAAVQGIGEMEHQV